MNRLRGRPVARMPLLLVFGALLAGSLFGCALPTREQEPEEQIALATAVEQSTEEPLQSTCLVSWSKMGHSPLNRAGIHNTGPYWESGWRFHVTAGGLSRIKPTFVADGW